VERIAIEATTGVVPLYQKLTIEGHDVLVSHQKKIRYIPEAYIKTDRVDSPVLAEMLRLNSLP